MEQLARAAMPRYVVESLLGYGGMAGVYLAQETRLGRRVAIKVMAPALMLDPTFVARFEQEARTVAQLAHPNIVTVFDVDERDELHYFVMEYLPGPSLRQVMSDRGGDPLPVPIVLHWVSQIASALGYAHHARVVHRDVKPANIQLDAYGDARVTDFGIAKVAHDAGLTRTGFLVGTPSYMSPEQCDAGTVTGASDQYVLGVVAYELLAGRPPFSGPTMEVVQAHLTRTPPALGELRPDCPERVWSGIQRMLSKRPEERFPSVTAAAAAIGAQVLPDEHPDRALLAQLSGWTQATAESPKATSSSQELRTPTPVRPSDSAKDAKALADAESAIDTLLEYETPSELAEALQTVGRAVDRALRRLLRSDPGAPDDLRLSAFSPVELPPALLLQALRTRDLISLELAGIVGELHHTLERVASGEPRAADADVAVAAVASLRTGILSSEKESPRGSADLAAPGRAQDEALPRTLREAPAKPLPTWASQAALTEDAGEKAAIARRQPMEPHHKLARWRAVRLLFGLPVVIALSFLMWAFWPAAEDGGAGDRDYDDTVDAWRYEGASDAVAYAVTVRPRVPTPRGQLSLELQLRTSELEQAVISGQADARLRFEYFVGHRIVGEVAPRVDEDGRLHASISLPDPGKYHVDVEIVGEGAELTAFGFDICVGANPDGVPEEYERLCPNMNAH